MYYLGIDLGTTSISAAVLDESGHVCHVQNVPQDRFLPSAHLWERMQDAELTAHLAEQLAAELQARFSPVGGIGVTGQMHGILYVDGQGRAVSPLYTWQDGRAALDAGGGVSYADALARETGCKAAPGFGLASHRYNLAYGLVPGNAAHIVTIGAYVAMRLTGAVKPVLHATEADSLGAYLAQEGRFAIDDALLPAVVRGRAVMGYTAAGVPVYVSIGDNQASFFGSVETHRGTVLVNVGTGSQVSVHCENYVTGSDFECRPYIDGGWLLVGCPLCGGRAYALLESFLRQCAQMAGADPGRLYDAMNRMAERHLPDAPAVTPLFSGTRADPSATASIAGLTAENFTPAHLVCGMVEGMAQELYGYYRSMERHISGAERIIGSGAGIERNPALRRRLAEIFGLPLKVSDRSEAAACGAARFATPQK